MTTLISIKHNSELLAEIDQIAEECSQISGTQGLAYALKMAAGMQALRERLTPAIMKDIKALMGSRLGFLTDRDKPRQGQAQVPYPDDVIRDVMIEGMLRGARACNNEINIISAGCYLTREFFTRKLREYPGLTNLRIKYSAVSRPTNISDEGKGRAAVACEASWQLNGVEDSLEKSSRAIEGSAKEVDERFIIPFDKYTSDDAILGKVDRKFKAAIYARITGTTFIPEGEVDDVPRIERAAAPTGLDDLTKRLSETKTETNGTLPETKEAKTETIADKNDAKPVKTETVAEMTDFEMNLQLRLEQAGSLGEITAVEKEFLAAAKTDAEHFLLEKLCTRERNLRKRK